MEQLPLLWPSQQETQPKELVVCLSSQTVGDFETLYVGHQSSCLLLNCVNLSPDVNGQTAIYQ